VQVASSEPSVTACIPYYRGKRYVRRAVESLLRQTHRDIRIIVVNDGDADPPWDVLSGFSDPRLVRFNLTYNHGGPFFANAVVLGAVDSPWFLVQEQDDWSSPDRVRVLLQQAIMSGADVAISAHSFYYQRLDGSLQPLGSRWRHMTQT